MVFEAGPVSWVVADSLSGLCPCFMAGLWGFSSRPWVSVSDPVKWALCSHPAFSAAAMAAFSLS